MKLNSFLFQKLYDIRCFVKIKQKYQIQEAVFIINKQQNKVMQKNTKAWLKVTYMKGTYLPVIILQRTNQLRSFIVDESGPIDRSLGYYVDDNLLLPRDQNNQHRNLFQLEHVNLPELKKRLSENQFRNKYLPVGNHLMIDIRPTAQNDGSGVDEELEIFYKSHIQILLNNKKQKQKLAVIVSKQNANPHYYVHPLFQLLAKTTEMWPHKLKIEKLSVILKKMFSHVSMEIKLGFVQHKSNMKQSRKVTYVHLKPYIPICPTAGLSVPSEILSIGNTDKFSKMYKGPIPSSPQTPPSQIQMLVDAFLCLGVDVKTIHFIMKLLSILLNLSKLKITKQQEGPRQAKYITYHLKNIDDSKNYSAYENINELLQLQPQQLQNLLIFGQNDSGGRSLKDRQKSEYLQSLGTKHEVASYRLHIMKFIIYQVMILEVCKILNQKICTEDFAQEDILQDTQFENKTFMLFSYGVAVNNDLRTLPKQLQPSLFWNDARQILENKIRDIVKSSVLCSIIGTTTINSNKNKQKQSQNTQKVEKGYISRKKKHGQLQNKSQMNLKMLQNQIDYEQEIDGYIKSIKNPQGNVNLQYKQVTLLEKQLYLHKLYQQMSSYKIFTEIAHRLLNGNDKMVNKNIIEEIPYSMYEYIWPNYYKLQNFNSPTLSFQKDYLVITNSKEVTSHEKFLQKIVDAVHMRKIKMDEGEQDLIGIQVKLDDFANRYLYTNFCKQKVHQVYPQPIQKISKKSSKKLKISQATQYLDHSITVEELGQKIQKFLSKQFSPNLEIAKQNVYSKDSSKALKVKDPEFLQNLQKQVQKQFESAKKIQMQFYVYQNRKRTLQILNKIWRERKLQKILARLQGLFRKRVGFKQIIDYDYSKVVQEEKQKKRLQQLRQGNGVMEQRERIRRERQQKKAAAKAREQQKKRVEQLRQKRYQQHERLQQQKIQQRNRLKAQNQAKAQKEKEQRQAAEAQQQKQKQNEINRLNQQKNEEKKANEPDNKKQAVSESKQQKPKQLNQEKQNQKQKKSQQDPKTEDKISQQEPKKFSDKQKKPIEQPQKQAPKNPAKKEKKTIDQDKKKEQQVPENKQIKSQNQPTQVQKKEKQNQTLPPSNEKQESNKKLSEQKNKENQNQLKKQEKVEDDAPFILSQPDKKNQQPKRQDAKSDPQQKKAVQNENPEKEPNPKPKQQDAPFILQDPNEKKQDPQKNPVKPADKKNEPISSKPSEPKVQDKKTQPQEKKIDKTPLEQKQKPKEEALVSDQNQKKDQKDEPKDQDAPFILSDPNQKKDQKEEPQKSTQPKEQVKKTDPIEKKPVQTEKPKNQDAPFILSDPNQKKNPTTTDTKQQPKIVLTPPPKSEQPQNKKPEKKKQNQFIDKSQEKLQQLTKQELQSIVDNPTMTLEEWQKNCKIKFGQFNQKTGRQMFTKYASMTQRIPAKPYQYPKLIPNQESINKLFKNDYFSFTKQIINCNNDDKIQAKMLSNQKDQMTAPLLKAYPMEKYPTFFKQAFNAVLKIGLEKNSSKKIHQLLNIITVPINKSYQEEIQKSKTSSQKQGLPSDYSSHHNALKDEVFLYFVKQITSQNPDKPPPIKNVNAYLFGMSFFTRYYCPSPNFINPLTSHINSLRKLAIQKNQSQAQRNLLDSVYQNLLFFVQASEYVKKNPVNLLLDEDKNKKKLEKSEVQNNCYLQVRKSAIRQNQINKLQDDKKPQPITITIWLVNHEPFTFPVRNQIALSLKKKILTQIGYISREQCFSLYFLQPNYTFSLIDQKEKVLNLIPLTQIYKQKKLRRPIYLRLTHYFPFTLKDINSTRLAYLNMISEQITFPWKAEQYEFVVAQSMCYQDYEQIRIGNYLQFTRQASNKSPNMKPVQQKFRALIGESKKKICQYEYMRYSKEMGFLLIKCFQMDDDPNYIIGVKPNQIVFYKDKNKFCSMGLKRIKNIYMQGSKIVLEVYYKNTLQKGKQQTKQRLRTHTIIQAQKPIQLFKSILFQLENRISH